MGGWHVCRCINRYWYSCFSRLLVIYVSFYTCLSRKSLIFLTFYFIFEYRRFMGFLGDSVVRNPPANAGDVGSFSGLGRSLGEGNGNPLQYLCLGKPMELGGVQSMESQKNWTWWNNKYPANYFVIVSSEQPRDSAIHIYVSILPQTFLPSRLPHNTKQNSLCYTVGPCWLSILNTAVCTHPSQAP